MLAYHWHKTQGKPIVLLHGLLGSQQDWASLLALLQFLPEIRPLTLDLPYHGLSQTIPCNNFTDSRTLLHHTLSQIIDEPFWLVGYSLGGRLALDYALNQENPYLAGLILEGANVGLTNQTERDARLTNDQQWAMRFQTEPLATVLNDWYQQPVFAHLTAQQRAKQIEKRLHNNGTAIAKMLLATSLAKQENFANKLAHFACPVHFLIGEKDQKFQAMAQHYQLNYQLIHQAGHNAHSENPQGFAEKMLQLIHK